MRKRAPELERGVQGGWCRERKAAGTDTGSMRADAKDGRADGVLLISSDLDELIHTSDRIMVMSRGKIVDILEAKNATKERLGQLMLGVSQET